jgi:hypothetical protein
LQKDPGVTVIKVPHGKPASLHCPMLAIGNHQYCAASIITFVFMSHSHIGIIYGLQSKVNL